MRLYRLTQTLLSFVAIVLVMALSTSAAWAQNYAKPNKDASMSNPEAAKHMGAGLAFLGDPDGAKYEEAYPEFRRAYELSGSPNALRMLGICSMKLELDGEAIIYFRRFLKEEGDKVDAELKAEVERDKAALEAVVAWVTLSSDRPNTTVKDQRTPRSGSTVRNSYKITLNGTKLGIHPGEHVFTATADGKPDQVWKKDIKNGEKLNHEFVFEPNKPFVVPEDKNGDKKNGDKKENGADDGPSRPIPASVWVVGALTIGVGAAGGVLAGLAASDKSDYDSNIKGKKPLEEQQSAFDAIKTKNLVADIMFGVAGAGAVTTLILILTRPEAEPDAKPPEKQGLRFGVDWTVLPIVDTNGGAGAWLTATF